MSASATRLAFLFVIGLMLSLVVSTAYAAAAKGPTKCADGLDNDGDELKDDADPDCTFGNS